MNAISQFLLEFVKNESVCVLYVYADKEKDEQVGGVSMRIPIGIKGRLQIPYFLLDFFYGMCLFSTYTR